MQVLKRMSLRIATLVILTALVYGALLLSGAVSLGTDVDAVTKATGVIVPREDVEGSFVVLINTKKHQNAQTLQEWERFFGGEDIGLIFEDVVCYVASGDTAATELAESFQSRLPENQMKIKTVPSAMVVAKAEHDVFDVVILSDAVAVSLGADVLYEKENVKVIEA